LVGGVAKKLLLDILDTPISPELVSTNKGIISQKTEDLVGPYELHDFFLYRFIRYRESPEKILWLAEHAFKETYKPSEIQKWLKMFLTRFAANQWKRSVMPDGPKVGSVSLSPRGDWRMPSDVDPGVF
jgi:NAD+ synthase (glutamine-hydrolysing)